MKNDETLTVSINCTSYPLLPSFTLSLLAWLMQSKLLGRRWEPNERHTGYPHCPRQQTGEGTQLITRRFEYQRGM